MVIRYDQYRSNQHMTNTQPAQCTLLPTYDQYFLTNHTATITAVWQPTTWPHILSIHSNTNHLTNNITINILIFLMQWIFLYLHILNNKTPYPYPQPSQSRAIVTWERPLLFRQVHFGDPQGSLISFSGQRSVLLGRSVGYTMENNVGHRAIVWTPLQDIEDNEHGALQYFCSIA